MRIQEFLLARVAQDEERAATTHETTYELGPNRAHAVNTFERRRAVIHRHHDRLVTEMALGDFATIARCELCVHETMRPCRALRALARPDRTHPDYDTDWNVPDSSA